LLIGARDWHLLAGTDVKAADVLHFGRNEALFATSKPNTDPPTTPNLESDYEPLYEPTAVVVYRQEMALRQKVLGKPAKIYLLPRPYLVKELPNKCICDAYV